MLTHDDVKAVPYTPESTTVIGDISQLDEYINSGHALHDWESAIIEIKRRFEEEVVRFPHVWDHIVIPASETKKRNHRNALIMERLTEIFHS